VRECAAANGQRELLVDDRALARVIMRMVHVDDVQEILDGQVGG
jgi:hypothetical protein